MDPEESISKLLRLKRYEQPRPDYFEDFLAEFQLRQRAEVIHRPFWNIAWDRFSSLFSPLPSMRLVTASSFAAAMIATGVTPVGNTPAEFAAGIKADLAKWAKVARAANIRVE